MSLSDLKRTLAQQCYGRQPDGKTCIDCSRPFEQGVNMTTSAGWAEVKISGLCESCFDRTTQEPEED